MKPIGVIVAGGRARRLGGGDKTLRMIGGRPVLARLIERLAPQCDALVLNANGEPGRFGAFGLPVMADGAADADTGPLAGVAAGLDWLADHRPDARDLMTVPGDTPFVPRDLALRLAAARAQDGSDIAAATSGGRRQPLVALWPTAAHGVLRHALRDRGLRRLSEVLDAFRVSWVDWPTTPVDPFLNLNTPEDIAAAERWAMACGG